MLPALALLFGLLILPSAEVQQPANRRRPVGIDLYQVEVTFLSHSQGSGDREHPQVLAPLSDYPNLSCPDPLVYTKIAKYTGVLAK
jgi:hypothetical protein